ncbi:MAG: TlpA family protein disulfide reductase [Chloroflexi bacterium]|nr:TlpA family protein disulfide reductase [Chloroflexota bacterium]
MKITRRGIGFGAVIIVVIGLLVLLGIGLANSAPVTGRSGFTRIGKPAPEFKLSLFDGGEVDLATYRGKPIVINFWASWCVPCRQEAPILERLWRSYREEGVQFVGVDIQDAEVDSLRYLREFDITYPNGLDTDGRITVDYGVIGIPVTFFINRQGIVVRRWVGAVSETRMTQWVQELAEGEAPTGEVEAENLEGFRTLN